MKKLVSIFVKFPFYANILIAIIVIGGGLSLASMKKSFFPERKSRDITVMVTYPGASPKEMEEGITTRIEESVRGLVGIKEINSTSSENVARVVITTTGEYDLDETLTEVKNSVDGISSFPSAAERPIVFKRRSISRAMFMSLNGNVDLMTLKHYANQIEEDLLSSGKVTQMNVSGFPALEISIEVTEQNLMRYGLTFDQVSTAIAMNNRDISAGQIKSLDEEILIRSRSRSLDPNIIGDIIIRADNAGRQIRVRDVGEVKMKFADVSNRSTLNGKEAVYFDVSKLIEEDLEEISDYVREYVAEFNAKTNEVQLEVTFDFLDVLESRLDLLYNNGMVGLLLVVLTLAVFLSFRLSLWVAWGIPASFLSMFILAAQYGVTINMISLFGMILVIGILVDDGIVIAENIYSHFEKGKSAKRAAIDGTMEVLPAVTTSVTTTIIAFTPLLLLEGRMEMMFEMAFVVIFSLLFSLVEAFFILPGHVGSKHVLRSEKRSGIGNVIRGKLEQFINYMREKLYGRFLNFILRWNKIFLFVPIALVFITIGLAQGGFIKATFFPSIPFDSFTVDVAFKPGDGERQTVKHLKVFEKAIWEVNKEIMEEYNDTSDYIKYTIMSLGNSFSGQETGAHAGNINVFLRDMEGAPISSFEISSRVRKKIGPFSLSEKFKIGGRNRWGSPVSISLLGSKLTEIQAARDFLVKELSNIEDINNITDNNAKGKREVLLKLKPKAYFLGLNQAAISNQVRQGFYGGQVQRMQQGRDEVRVWVRYPKQDRLTIGQMENMKIKTMAGEYPLSELAEYTIERGPVSIKRFNAKREIRVDADLVDPYAPVPPILARVDKEILPILKTQFPGVQVMYQGQQRDSNEAAAEMKKYFSVAFAIIILILMIHFRSALQASIVLMMIPLAWLGAVWGHVVEGFPVSMLSAWGMVALSGVIINDAVVFLSKYNSLLLEGKKVNQAVYEAALARFRPIVLTTITTTVGLYPLILQQSFQAQFLIPMAISLAYGVLIGTAFILIFFPVLIIGLNDAKRFIRYILTGSVPTREEMEAVIIHSKVKIDEDV